MDFDTFNTLIPPCEYKPSENILIIPPETLSLIAQKAFERLSFTFTQKHLEHLTAIVHEPLNSVNDRLVASFLLQNALISAKEQYPLCQDTGIAQIFAWKDETIFTGYDPIEPLSEGTTKTWTEKNLRFSTTIPTSLFEETNPSTNLPVQIALFNGNNRKESKPTWRFLFCAKGGGSSNKTHLVQATKALLNEEAFTIFLRKQIQALGTAACPPYSICIIVGGLSPEQNLLALKLATAGYFDQKLSGWDYRVFGVIPLRIHEWEKKVSTIAEETGLGAQFGGKALAISARVFRLPRHGASCPVSIGVSCSAHRNLHGFIDEEGIHLEATVSNPASIPGLTEAANYAKSGLTGCCSINLDEGIENVRKILSKLSPGTPVLLSGDILVARDAAHARWRENLRAGMPLPSYTTQYAILYAGPSETPPSCITGSFGPTTAGRMDEYAEELMSRNCSLVTLAKGNRSESWRKACEQYGGTYLGTVGGAAALIAEKHIRKSEILDYPDLGMEAVRIITLVDLPAFVLINDKGEDFYSSLGNITSC